MESRPSLEADSRQVFQIICQIFIAPEISFYFSQEFAMDPILN
jgi:hypothetical protein